MSILNDSPIQTALCSFGMSGRVFHAPFIHANPGFNFYGVWERSNKLAQRSYPEVKSVNTYNELLRDENIELVIVNTPNATHFDFARRALLAGKHVVVEKPFTVTSSEAEALLELVAESGKKLAVYHNRRYDSDSRLLMQVLNEKMLGEVLEAEFHFDRYKEELSAKLHKETPGPGTGTLYDLGSHLIDLALQLFGTPKAVYGDIDIMRPLSKVDDYFEVVLFYDKLRVRLKSTYQAKEAIPAFVLHGTEGSFIKPRADVQEDDLVAGKTPDAPNWGMEPLHSQGILNNKAGRTLLNAPNGNYMSFFNELYAAIRLDEEVPVTALEATDVIKIIEAAYKSNAEKMTIQLEI